MFQLHCFITPEQPPLWLTKKDTPTFHRLQKVKHISQQKLRTSIRMSDFNYKSFLSKPWGGTFKSISFASIKDRYNFIQVFSVFSVGTGCTRVLALHVPSGFWKQTKPKQAAQPHWKTHPVPQVKPRDSAKEAGKRPREAGQLSAALPALGQGWMACPTAAPSS